MSNNEDKINIKILWGSDMLVSFIMVCVREWFFVFRVYVAVLSVF